MDINSVKLRKALIQVLSGGGEGTESSDSAPPPDPKKKKKLIVMVVIGAGALMLITVLIALTIQHFSSGNKTETKSNNDTTNKETTETTENNDIRNEPDGEEWSTGVSEWDGAPPSQCSGGLVVPDCNINTGDVVKNETDCPNRFVKWADSFTGFMQCQWESSKNKCNVNKELGDGRGVGWRPCSASAPLTCHSSVAWQGADSPGVAGPIVKATEQAQCICPDGTSFKNHGTKHIWRCLSP
tara:strand:+ start:634 stop:1356 length:723 start_codon:yes stop_codon:yes gene_type:complete